MYGGMSLAPEHSLGGLVPARLGHVSSRSFSSVLCPFSSRLLRSTQLTPHSPANEKMLFTRLSLLALVSTLVSIVSGLEIIAPGGSNLWWGE